MPAPQRSVPGRFPWRSQLMVAPGSSDSRDPSARDPLAAPLTPAAPVDPAAPLIPAEPVGPGAPASRGAGVALTFARGAVLWAASDARPPRVSATGLFGAREVSGRNIPVRGGTGGRSDSTPEVSPAAWPRVCPTAGVAGAVAPPEASPSGAGARGGRSGTMAAGLASLWR